MPNLSKKRFPLIVGIIFALAASYSVIAEAAQPVNFSFSSGACSDSLGNGKLRNGVYPEWVDDNTLEIKVIVTMNCADKIDSGDYEIADNRLILKYVVTYRWGPPRKPPVSSGPASVFPPDDLRHIEGRVYGKCSCQQSLLFKFANLERKNYQYEIQEKELPVISRGAGNISESFKSPDQSPELDEVPQGQTQILNLQVYER